MYVNWAFGAFWFTSYFANFHLFLLISCCLRYLGQNYVSIAGRLKCAYMCMKPPGALQRPHREGFCDTPTEIVLCKAPIYRMLWTCLHMHICIYFSLFFHIDIELLYKAPIEIGLYKANINR